MGHAHSGILFSHEIERSLTIRDDTDGPGGDYAKRNTSEKGRTVRSHLYVGSKEQNKRANERETDSQTQKELMVVRWEGGWATGAGTEARKSAVTSHRDTTCGRRHIVIDTGAAVRGVGGAALIGGTTLYVR